MVVRREDQAGKRGEYLSEGGKGIVLLILLPMATNWMVGGKGSARDRRRLSLREWPRNSLAPSPPNGY